MADRARELLRSILSDIEATRVRADDELDIGETDIKEWGAKPEHLFMLDDFALRSMDYVAFVNWPNLAITADEIRQYLALPDAAPTDPYVCYHCGSNRVFSDAWVGVNDPAEVLGPYDTKFCSDCEGETKIVRRSEFNNEK